MLITFSGAHGTGKTWLKEHLIKYIKDNKLFNGEVLGIDGITRSLFHEGKISGHSKKATAKDQIEIFKEIFLTLTDDTVVYSDRHLYVSARGFFDLYAYTEWLSEYGDGEEYLRFTQLSNMFRILLTSFYTHDALCGFYVPITEEIHDDNFREVDSEYQKQIDEFIVDTFEPLSVYSNNCSRSFSSLFSLTGDRESMLKQASEIVETLLLPWR